METNIQPSMIGTIFAELHDNTVAYWKVKTGPQKFYHDNDVYSCIKCTKTGKEYSYTRFFFTKLLRELVENPLNELEHKADRTTYKYIAYTNSYDKVKTKE
jgi:hypothetical protein